MDRTKASIRKANESQPDYMELIKKGRLLHDQNIACALKSMFTIFDASADKQSMLQSRQAGQSL